MRDGCINAHNIKIGKVEECDGIGSSCLDALNWFCCGIKALKLSAYPGEKPMMDNYKERNI